MPGAPVPRPDAALDAALSFDAPKGPALYNQGHWDPAATASDKGYALLAHSDPTEALTAAWQSQAFPAHPVVAPSGTLTLAVASPYAPPP